MSAAEMAMPEEDYEKLLDDASESALVTDPRQTSSQRHKMQGGAGADASSMRHSGAGFRNDDDARIAVTPGDRVSGSDDDDEADARAQVRSTTLWVFAAGVVGIAAVALVSRSKALAVSVASVLGDTPLHVLPDPAPRAPGGPRAAG